MNTAEVIAKWREEAAAGKTTYGSTLDPCMKVQTPEEAAALLDGLVEVISNQFNQDPAHTRRVQLENVGYYTGYCDHETADRVLRCFDTSHPIFGRSHPSPREAFAAGVKMGQEKKEEDANG